MLATDPKGASAAADVADTLVAVAGVVVNAGFMLLWGRKFKLIVFNPSLLFGIKPIDLNDGFIS